jgi:D-alanine transaminase
MPRLAYVNGQYLPHDHAAVSIEDRGFQFADGIYEVVAVVAGQIVDMAPHMTRLQNSLDSLGIRLPMTRTSLQLVMRQLVRRNHLTYGILYMQVSRGVAPRDHAYAEDLRPTLVMTCRSVPAAKAIEAAQEGVSVKTFSEERWARPDIKTISLLPNVLAKQAARQAGDYEAWFVDGDGHVTEGASTNAWIVTKKGTLVTRPLSKAILPGVVRGIILGEAKKMGLSIEEGTFTVADALDAKEAFITSTGGVMPVVAIDASPVGDAVPGEATLRLVAAYQVHLANQTKDPDATLQVLTGS